MVEGLKRSESNERVPQREEALVLRLYYELVYRRFTMPWEASPPGEELV